MFYFRCKLIFEKKKKEQVHKPTSPHSHQNPQAHTFPCTRITLDHCFKEGNSRLVPVDCMSSFHAALHLIVAPKGA